MCDTMVADRSATKRRGVLFAKNSDRERNEAQVLEVHPGRPSRSGRTARLTYIVIDDAEATHACLLSRPFWMWGAEMGVNEHGVVIGNEAIHALVPPERRRALIGMDLVRLGLERSATAADAVQVMTALLERHGQGGDCGHKNSFHYHNGFIIADPNEAYVLETVGRWWVVERVSGVRTLSNALSIGAAPHAISPTLREHAEAREWLDDDGRFDFAARLIDPERDAATFGRGRCARAAALLAPRVGHLDVADLIAVLRDHGAEAEGDPEWSPRKTVNRSICMHAATGARRSQSVASLVSDLTAPRPLHWVTGTSAPCLSLFKPVVLGFDLPDQGPSPTDHFDEASLWWRHERLHRRALKDFPTALAAIAQQRDQTEAGFRSRIAAASEKGDVELAEAVRVCWREAEAIEADWSETVQRITRAGPSAIGKPAALAWARLSAAAGMPA
jgi:dipeptidase